MSLSLPAELKALICRRATHSLHEVQDDMTGTLFQGEARWFRGATHRLTEGAARRLAIRTLASPTAWESRQGRADKVKPSPQQTAPDAGPKLANMEEKWSFKQ